MEFWIGIVCAVLFAAGIAACAMLAKRNRKWVIGSVACAIFTLVFLFYSVLTLLLTGGID